MKTTHFLFVLLFLAGTTTLSSCSKENRIERNLWKKGGEWNIESLEVTQVSTNSTDNYEQTVFEYGTLTFKQDGSGRYLFTVDGDVETGTFDYTNTENQLTLIIDNQARIFDIVEWEKNDMSISITEKYTSNGESITYTEKYNLKKK